MRPTERSDKLSEREQKGCKLMVPNTADQWRETVKERRIARFNAGYEKHFLDEIVDRLAAQQNL